MNPYAFLAKLLGIGLVAGTAVAMVKLVEKVWPKADTEDGTFEYIAVAGEFPPEDEEACADAANEAASHTAETGAENETAGHTAGTGAENETAGHTAGTIAENEAAGHTAEAAAADDAALSVEEPAAPIAAPVSTPAAAAPDAPNENPVDAPPAVPVTDPLKIADPADFQDWDELGCQG